jgi:DNA-binding transcriptional ArsR family regulator
MANVVDETTINRMARLIGDPDKAECKVKNLRSITQKLDQDAIEAESEIFKSMGDPCRVKILMLLKEGELCVCEIMIALDRPQSTTSHHLSILRDAGLIREREDGTWSKYRLAEGAVIEMLKLGKIMAESKEVMKDDKN